jgi:hypothetical protein
MIDESGRNHTGGPAMGDAFTHYEVTQENAWSYSSFANRRKRTRKNGKEKSGKTEKKIAIHEHNCAAEKK